MARKFAKADKPGLPGGTDTAAKHASVKCGESALVLLLANKVQRDVHWCYYIVWCGFLM